jgi:hypothetical protein
MRVIKRRNINTVRILGQKFGAEIFVGGSPVLASLVNFNAKIQKLALHQLGGSHRDNYSSRSPKSYCRRGTGKASVATR